MTQEAKPNPFRLGLPANFWWTVRVPVPVHDDYQVAELDVLFEPKPQDRIDQMRGLQPLPDGQVLTETQICREVVRGWKRLLGEDGQDVPFSPQALEQALAAPLLRASIVATYLAAMTGMAARKNV